MSAPQHPQGWYPDPWRQGALRWWDGAQWTSHLSGTTAALPAYRSPLPEGSPIYGPFIWLVALLPLASAFAIWLYHPDLTALADWIQQTDASTDSLVPLPLGAIYNPGYFALIGIGLLVFAAVVVFAYLDERRLKRLGVVRPFPWGWAFLTLVYPIGRSIIVAKVAPRAYWPMWVAIAVYVAVFISSAIWEAQFIEPFSTLIVNTPGTTT